LWAIDAFGKEDDFREGVAQKYQGRLAGVLDIHACRALNIALANV
jgi:hypothetical protein